MNTLLSVVLLLLIVLIAVGLVFTIGNPIVDASVKTSDIKSAEADLHFIDDYIRSVAAEGRDSMRIYRFTSPKDFESIPGENAVQFYTDSPVQLIDYLTRSFSGNFAYVSGADVNCQEKDGDEDGVADLVAENTRIRAVFKKVSSGMLNTSQILTRLVDKTNNVTTFVANSSIVIDEDYSTSGGEGFVRIGRSGTSLPVCVVQAFINSTLDYDIYYKLYAGADFLTVEVVNIR